MAALRVVCAASAINPAVGRLCPTFLFLLKHRALDAHSELCTCLSPYVMPLSWKTNRPHSKVRSDFTVDKPANLAPTILGSLSFAHQANATLLLEHTTLVKCVHVPVTVYSSRQCRISYVQFISIWFI